MTDLEHGPAASSSQSRQSEVEPLIDDLGFTEVYNPSTSNPPKDTIADLVFVHGLGGHPRKTWTHEGVSSTPQRSSAFADSVQKQSRWKKILGRSKTVEPQAVSTNTSSTEKSESCYWPYHLLPKDKLLSSARILVYGYESRPTKFYKAANRMTITQHARELNNQLAQARSESRGRALIFVAHSLAASL
jgi:hypothetical protein